MLLSETHKQPLVDMLRNLVRIDSRSDPSGGHEGAVQAVVARRMRELGARVRTFEVDDLPAARTHPLFHGPQRNYRDRPTVIGEIGPVDAPALLVLAHSDTVPLFAPDQWTLDPFAAELREDRIYGLGASDDKWALATMLVMMQALQSHGSLGKRLIFASTIDEESGVGNGTLLLHLAGIGAEAGLYLDGYAMEIGRGNCGGPTLYLRPRQPVSPEQLDQDLASLKRQAEVVSLNRERLFDRPGFEANWARRRSFLPAPRSDSRGKYLQIGCYTVPGERPEEIEQTLSGLISAALGGRAAAYEQSIRLPWFEPALVPQTEPILGCLESAAATVLGRPPTVGTVSKIDGFVLTNHAKIPTVSFGCTHRVVGRGAFHGPDEYLTIGELWDGCRTAHEAVQRWLEL